MSVFVWWFLREAPGKIVPLAARFVRDFHDGKHPLPAAEPGFVHLAYVAGTMEDRQAQSLALLEFTRAAVDSNGIHNPQLSLAVMRDAMNITFDLTPAARPADNVIPGERRFAQAAYRVRTRWIPTPDDLVALQSAIRKKAGRNLGPLPASR